MRDDYLETEDFWIRTGLQHSFFHAKHKSYNNKRKFSNALVKSLKSFDLGLRTWTNKYKGKFNPITDRDKNSLLTKLQTVKNVIEDLEFILIKHSGTPLTNKFSSTYTIIRRIERDINRNTRDLSSHFLKIRDELQKIFNQESLINMIQHKLADEGFFFDKEWRLLKTVFRLNPKIRYQSQNPSDKKRIRDMLSTITDYILNRARDFPIGDAGDIESLLEPYPTSGFFGISGDRHTHLILVVQYDETKNYEKDFEYYSITLYIYHFVNVNEHDSCFRLTRSAKVASNIPYGHICACGGWKFNKNSIEHTANDPLGKIKSNLKKYQEFQP